MNKNYNENHIREAAYYNWQNAGCPSGQDEYFWNQAVKQLYGSSKSCGCSKSLSKTKSCAKKSSPAKTSTAKTTASKKTVASKK